jgi:hypothetical protein
MPAWSGKPVTRPPPRRSLNLWRGVHMGFRTMHAQKASRGTDLSDLFSTVAENDAHVRDAEDELRRRLSPEDFDYAVGPYFVEIVRAIAAFASARRSG